MNISITITVKFLFICALLNLVKRKERKNKRSTFRRKLRILQDFCFMGGEREICSYFSSFQSLYQCGSTRNC